MDSLGDDHELELAEEHLVDWQSGVLSGEDEELRVRMIEFNQREVRETRLARLLSEPFLPTDRPGEQTVQGKMLLEHNGFPRPTRLRLPAPVAGRTGSWKSIATGAIVDHFAQWPWVSEILAGEPVMLDIAIGRAGWDCFDVDNLAHRVTAALRKAAPQLDTPRSYRVYRRSGVDDAVVVTLHSEERAERLRNLLNGGWSAAMGLRPDREAPVYRRRPSVDDEMYEEDRGDYAAEKQPSGRTARNFTIATRRPRRRLTEPPPLRSIAFGCADRALRLD